MIALPSFTTPPHECAYLPDQQTTMKYRMVMECTPDDLQLFLDTGWRRFGTAFFKPVCESCRECLSLRVPLATFQPNRSQRRAIKDNLDVELRIGPASVSRVKLNLYDKFHEHQAHLKGWPDNLPKDAGSYADSFVRGPLPTEEWCYFLDNQLIGVGYVDVAPKGLSAIYFFYDPDHKDRSLGTMNVMRFLAESSRRGMTYGYLGYFVEGCPSVSYKGNFKPNEVITETGEWVHFR